MSWQTIHAELIWGAISWQHCIFIHAHKNTFCTRAVTRLPKFTAPVCGSLWSPSLPDDLALGPVNVASCNQWVSECLCVSSSPLNYCVTSTWWVMLERGTNIWQWLLGKRKKSKIAALERGGDGSQCLVWRWSKCHFILQSLTLMHSHQQKLSDRCLK